jgi:hypothetical protein
LSSPNIRRPIAGDPLPTLGVRPRVAARAIAGGFLLKFRFQTADTLC